MELSDEKIACIGGTGNLGKGLSLRLSILGYDVIVGSRKQEKAERIAKDYSKILESFGYQSNIIGLANEEAAKKADIAILTLPWEHAFGVVENLKDFLTEKIVISPLVPMEKVGNSFMFTPPPEGSAAEKVAKILGNEKVVSAYQTIPARRFADISENFSCDVVVCGDDKDAKTKVIELTKQLGLNAFDGGSLSNSRMVESITPLLLNVMMNNRIKREISIKFV